MASEYDLAVVDAIAKTKSIMGQYAGKEIAVAYSGGADSDVIMHFLRNNGHDVKGIFYDTGIEFKATHDHVEYMRTLGFDIEKIRAVRAVPTSNKMYGHPFLNKRVSDYLQRLQSHEFDFSVDGELPLATLLVKYPKCKTALRWWTNDWGDGSRFNIDRNKHLKEFLIQYGLPFKVSGKCCDGAKKMPFRKYAKEHSLDLIILGIRKSEGGSRAGAYSNCFVSPKSYKYGMYFPTFWWNNAVREQYILEHDIVLSAAYTKYGLQRTGCAACPFGRNFDYELDILEEYEPRLHKGITNIFKDTHGWTRKYRAFQEEMGMGTTKIAIDTKNEFVQLSLW